MVFMMVWVIFIDLDFARGFQKYIILEVLNDKLLSGPSPYLEDILHPHEVSVGDNYGWGHIDCTGICLKFPKIYNTWGVK